MRLRIFTILFFIACGFSLSAQGFPDRPNDLITVHDYSGMFSKSEVLKLTKLGDKVKRKQNIQILIIVVDSLDGLTPVDYVYELGESWKLDKFKKMLIVLLKPKTMTSKGEVFFATSYGQLDRAISDSQVQEIISETVIPNFKKKKLFKGTKKGIQRVAKTIKNNVAQQGV